jgi:FAD binding domain
MTWDSNGNIDGGRNVDVVDDGDMRVSGKIDGGSRVTLVSIHGSITVDGKIDGSSIVKLVSQTGSIIIGDRIDGSSQVSLRADAGSINIRDRIDGSSQVSLRADAGSISLSGRVDGASTMKAVSFGGSVSIGDEINGSSTVRLMSRHGGVAVGGKIDGSSTVSLTAADNIQIGGKIDGTSHVRLRTGGTASLGDRIDGQATVDFQACGGITIGERIDGGAVVRLATHANSITVKDKIDHGSTRVTFWPPGSLVVVNGIQGGAQVAAFDWAGPNILCDPGPVVTGHWWQNWPSYYGYVTDQRFYPRSLKDIAQAITAVGRQRPLKAVGAGWSFSDAALPFRTQTEVDRVSTHKRGASGTEDLSQVLRGGTADSPMDLLPEYVADDLAFAAHYDQATLTEQVQSGWNLPGMDTGAIIDTRGLAASLQSGLDAILSTSARKMIATGRFFFHVEAGITLAALEELLDHQHPRLALQAAGAPAATLAGALSTATHGAEFKWPLMVDQVRAIHLVGPGGEEWWIEGKQSIANHPALKKRYPKLDRAHFIAGHWKGIKGLTAQDVLNAVIVSMGTMGVVYSVVLEVVPQYGIQQIITKTNWHTILERAGVTAASLDQGDPAANTAVLGVLLDGSVNGTGIKRADNVYANLAINPYNLDCWITNRRVTPQLPVDSNSPALGVSDYINAISDALGRTSKSVIGGSATMGRLFDFLNYDTDVPINLWHLKGDFDSASALAGFLSQYSDLLTAGLATVTVQAVANATGNDPDYRGTQFLGDLLTGGLDAIQGTIDTSTSDRTDLASKAGSVGWGSGGMPGRGLEIALHSEKAFSFLQSALIDDLLQRVMKGQNKPLIGYISVRVSPQTGTLMGMQQFSPFSVMIEVVGYRSPEANALIDAIEARVLDMNEGQDLQGMLHWGLENDLLTNADLTRMPVSQPLRPGSKFTRLSAFQAVRKFLINGNTPCFDNNFVRRLGL